MQVTSLESLKLKTHLEHLVKAPTLKNAKILKTQIKRINDPNFQLVQDIFLSTLLRLMDDCKGLNENEMKTVYLECVNLILAGSKLTKLVPYKMLLMLSLKQVFDVDKNQMNKDLSEELKIAVMECFEISSRNLDYEIVEQFMVEENKILLGQCIFVCREMIVSESYVKIRKKSIEALGALLQIHDQFDLRDIVLRDQISGLIFFILPQISSTLIKVCREDTFKGYQLVETAAKVLGRFLCLVFEDYEKKSCEQKLTNDDFKKLFSKTNNDTRMDELNAFKGQPKGEQIMKMKRTHEWLQAASKRILHVLVQLKCLRGSDHPQVRNELLKLSVNLLKYCLPNIHALVHFLLENILTLSDDSDEDIQSSASKYMTELSKNILKLNEEISELFKNHLTIMPRIILTGDESEQISAFKLLNSLVKAEQMNFSKNPVLLEKFMNIMISCCEIEVPNELLFYENLSSNDLEDNFYKIKSPWQQFKNLKNDQIVSKFTEICRAMGAYESADIYVNFIMDNIESLEFLVLLIEILKTEKLNLSKDLVEEIVQEFQKEEYWSMQITSPISLVPEIQTFKNEEWFKDSVPGLYESSIEMRLKDISLEDESAAKSKEVNLKNIKYNILSTCFVLDLIGTAACCLQSTFQDYILKLLYRILQKAGNSNLLIRLAGLHALEQITTALGLSKIQDLIDENSEILLFNIHILLKRDQENDSLVDMLSVIFKFSQKSMIGYVEDIIVSVDERIVNDRFKKNAESYLKLFRLYTSSIKEIDIDENIENDDKEIGVPWNEFYDQCVFELSRETEEFDEMNDETKSESNSNITEDQKKEKTSENEEKPRIPEQIKLVIKILKTSLQFFASKNPKEVILTHQIFIDSLKILSHFENEFLPLIHEMWYPFTKQFQIQNLVVLQRSFELLTMIVDLAKDFVYKKSMDDVFPTINKFLVNSMKKTMNSKENLAYLQEFKLLKNILSKYGRIMITLDVDDRKLDEVVDILLQYEKSSCESLSQASNESLQAVKKVNSGLIEFKKKLNQI